MITLPLHTSRALHVSCFKPFKTLLKKVRDATMSISNHMEPNKITLVGWVDQAIFTKQNIKFRFRTKGIWLLNPKAMHNKTRPLKVYIV